MEFILEYLKKIKKLKIIFFTFSILLATTSYFFMDYLKHSYVEQKINNKTNDYLKIYNTVYNQYKELSEVFHDGIIELTNLPEKLSIYNKLNNKTKQDLIRQSLYNKIQTRYEKLKEKHLVSINIVLPDNTFILMMKNKNRYNFKASELRTDIKSVNTRQQRIDSFSIGKGGSGYRFLYPIFHKGLYVGMISFTFDASAITSNIMKQYNVLSNFYTKSEKFDKDFLKKTKQYSPSHHKGYLVNKKVLKELKKHSNINLIELILQKETVEKVYNNFTLNKATTVFDKNTSTTLTTIPVINKTNENIQAVLIIRTIANDIKSYLTMMNTMSILIVLFILLSFYLIYKLLSEKVVLANEVENKTKELEVLNNSLEEKIEEKTKELIKSNKKSQEQKEFLNTVIQSSPIPFFVKDLEGKYIDVNQSWLDLTGLSLEQTLNKSVYDIAPKDVADKYYEQDLKVFKLEENPQIYEYKVVNKSTKKEYDVIFYKSPYYDEEGNVKGLIGSVLDITQLKQLEEEKINREKLISEQSKFAQMGEMIENIAHQWRQPLSLITTISSGIKLNFEYGTFKKENAVEDLDTLIKTSNYLSETIDHFREFIKEKRELKVVRVQERIKNVLNILDASLKNNHIELITELNEKISLDAQLVKGELSQVLINIINNSKDAFVNQNIEKKWIKITCTKKENFALISVEDNAGGIPDEIIDKIFNPYFTTKHQYKGTGIGLYMSKNIIEKQIHGNIYVENTSHGAKFFIEIPLTN